MASSTTAPREDNRCRFIISLRGLNRSAVGKTQVSFTSRRPQQLAPSTLTSLLACTNALRRAILRLVTLGGSLGPFLHFAVARHSFQNAPVSVHTLEPWKTSRFRDHRQQ